jgi:hypothetical protein
MNRIRQILFLLGLPIVALAQLNTLTYTTLSSAQSGGGQTAPPTFVTVASATGINVPSINNGTQGTMLFVDGEAERVIAQVGTTTTFQVLRGQNGTHAEAHLANALVWIGNPDWFAQHVVGQEPRGSCTVANLYAYPIIETLSGKWLTCDSGGEFAYAGPGAGDPRIPNARTTVADAAYSALPYDYVIAYTSLTATRAVTLPAANSMPGKVYIIVDESGSAGTDNITIAGGSNHCTGVTTNYGSTRCGSNGTAWYNR